MNFVFIFLESQLFCHPRVTRGLRIKIPLTSSCVGEFAMLSYIWFSRAHIIIGLEYKFWQSFLHSINCGPTICDTKAIQIKRFSTFDTELVPLTRGHGRRRRADRKAEGGVEKIRPPPNTTINGQARSDAVRSRWELRAETISHCSAKPTSVNITKAGDELAIT